MNFWYGRVPVRKLFMYLNEPLKCIVYLHVIHAFTPLNTLISTYAA